MRIRKSILCKIELICLTIKPREIRNRKMNLSLMSSVFAVFHVIYSSEMCGQLDDFSFLQ